MEEEKGQKDNNDLQNTTQKSKDRATQITLRTGGELRCSGRVNISSSTCDTRSVSVVINLVISRKIRKVRIMITNGSYHWSFVAQIFRNA